jgi:hypothetical protein
MFAWIPGGKSGRVIAIAVLAGLATGFLLVPRTDSPDDPKRTTAGRSAATPKVAE